MADMKKSLTSEEVANLYAEQGTLAGADLVGADLTDIYLIAADLSGADLSRANLTDAHMYGANLRGAKLFKANLERANLNGTDLRDVDFLGAIFRDTKLSNVILDHDFVVINERDAKASLKDGDPAETHHMYEQARDVYRALKVALDKQIPSRDVGMLFVREMGANRKMMPKFSTARIFSKFLDLSLGYGEQIGRIIASILVITFGSAVIYGFDGVVNGDQIIRFGNGEPFLNILGEVIYFSTVVFTTVGFGDMTPFGPIGKLTMMVESFSSTVYMAILIIALYKRSMAR